MNKERIRKIINDMVEEALVEESFWDDLRKSLLDIEGKVNDIFFDKTLEELEELKAEIDKKKPKRRFAETQKSFWEDVLRRRIKELADEA